MNLRDKADLEHNLVGHAGPHPQAYHQAVYDCLQRATRGKAGEAYKKAIGGELEKTQKRKSAQRALNSTKWSQKVKQTESSFFEFGFDDSLSDYTYFDEPITEKGDVIDWWHFSGSGRWEGTEPLKVTANPIGKLYDISMAPGDVPYVTKRVVELFNADKSLSDAIQFIPLRYGVNTIYLMNILPLVECVDDEKTESIMRWQVEDDEPGKIGQYRQIIGLRVDPERLVGIDICRVQDWEVSIIISQRVRMMLETHHMNGVVFWPV